MIVFKTNIDTKKTDKITTHKHKNHLSDSIASKIVFKIL